MMNRRVRVQSRIRWLVVILLAAMGVVVFRYAWLQLVQGNELSERMRYQVGQDYSIQSPRGAIVDRNGRELAVSTMTKSLFVDPNHVENAEAVAADLAPLIGKTEQEILDDIAVGGGFSWVKRRLEQPEYEAVRALIREKDYAGCLGFRDEAKRYYPNDVLAANVIGFVGTDDKGLDGIEQAAAAFAAIGVKKGDIVLVRLPGRYVMHRIIREEGEHLTLMGDGNLQGTESCTRADVLGTVHTILRDGKPRQPGDGKLWGRLLPFRRIILGIYRRLSSVSPSPEGRGFGRG